MTQNENVEQKYVKRFEDAKAGSKRYENHKTQILSDKKYEDFSKKVGITADKIIKNVNAHEKVSKKGKFNYPKRIIIGEMPDGQISLKTYLGINKGAICGVVEVEGYGKALAAYDESSGSIIVDPINETDNTDFAKLAKKYGIDRSRILNGASLEKVLFHEMAHQKQDETGTLKKAKKYKYGGGVVEAGVTLAEYELYGTKSAYLPEVEHLGGILKKYNIDPIDALMGGIPDEVFAEYASVAAPCHDSGKCIAK